MQADPAGASDGDDRYPVLGRLTEEQHRDMKLAMALAGIRTNDAFVVLAVEAKSKAILRKRRAGDKAA